MCTATAMARATTKKMSTAVWTETHIVAIKHTASITEGWTRTSRTGMRTAAATAMWMRMAKATAARKRSADVTGTRILTTGAAMVTRTVMCTTAGNHRATATGEATFKVGMA